mmetsp:Transcript_5378/g.18986  ORF Transcript_5378/g.18986 Transcript_5378/m.18986 type:complete len:96 (-) Transcript_5378:189-476(-)
MEGGGSDGDGRFVVEKFDLKDFESNAKSTILLDLYLWTLSCCLQAMLRESDDWRRFCKEAGLSEEKTSALFTIMKRLHEHSKGEEKKMKEKQDTR